MFGVTRYDPAAANSNAAQATTSSVPAAASSSGLDALKARAAAKKAEREAAAAAEPTPVPEPEGEASNNNAIQKAPPKAKTKAKERYLKKKSSRRKAAASKKSNGGLTTQSQSLSVEEQERRAAETPEEKAKRKKALKEARQARRAAATEAAQAQAQAQVEAAAAAAAEEDANHKPKEEETAAVPMPMTEEEEKKAQRKQERAAKRARKAMERAMLQQQSEMPLPVAHPVMKEEEEEHQEEKPKKKKKRRNEEEEEEQTAASSSKASVSAAKIISQAAKASKRSAKAASRLAAAAAAKHASDSEQDDHNADERNVEQLDALPVFQKPTPLAAPDSALLAELSVARELSDVHHVDARTTTSFQALADACALHPNLRTRLSKLDIQHFFAVQSAVLPLLCSPTARHRRRFPWPVRDLCINAPTGSGKTLSYVVPIVEQLSRYTGTKTLRALVLLPTKDLVQQLKETFDALVLGTDVKVGTATGQISFAKEQAKLANLFGASPVDVLIATPGRLMDHLAETKHFSLEHLEFFVVDEADRLLAQSFNDWLPPVMDALHQAMSAGGGGGGGDAATSSQPPLAPALTYPLPAKRKVQKLLLSATLSRDPVQISALKLHQPLYISISDAATSTASTSEFTLPPTLTEHMIVTSASLKPLMLLHILKQHQLTHGICFTKSTEAAARLVKLLQFLQEELGGSEQQQLNVASFSSDLPGHERTKLLNAFKAGHISLLVCSDLISRGIDLPHVSHVVNYDVPVDLRKYVHRVGRTARAGRTGDAWSLVETQEAAFFKTLHKQAGRLDKIKRLRVGAEVVEPMTEAYERSLSRLKETVVRS